MESRLISIIIPTFNREKTIGASIESVLGQSFQNWELIIVDDGSKDQTSILIRQYLKDERIKYLYQDNQGVSVARNNGVKHAIGDYLIFLDSDDTFYPGLIEDLNKSKYYKYDLICWKVLKIIDGKKYIWKARPLGGLYNNLKVTFFPGSICYKKEVFFQAGGFDPKMTFGENYELGIRISNIKGIKILLLNQIYLKYILITSQRTSNSLLNRLNSHLHQYNKHKRKYQDNPKANSEINYILGFVHEKLMKKKEAIEFYKISWKSNNLYLKPFLKVLYLKWIK